MLAIGQLFQEGKRSSQVLKCCLIRTLRQRTFCRHCKVLDRFRAVTAMFVVIREIGEMVVLGVGSELLNRVCNPLVQRLSPLDQYEL